MDRSETIDALRAQCRFVMDFEARDVLKRLASLVPVVGWLYAAGHVGAATASALSVLIMELANRFLYLTMPEQDDALSERRLLGTVLVHMGSASAYGSVAVHLAMVPDQSSLLLGVLWISGAIVHTIGAHALVRVWSWAAVAPLAISLAILIWVALETSYSTISPYGPWFVWFGTLFALGNMVEVIQRQTDNRKAFSDALVLASERLKQLEFHATHDGTTGLFNRRYFDTFVDAALQDRVPGRVYAVMVIDLNNFKTINDTHGHSAGDAVLRRQATAIDKLCEGHVTARLGGDEFAVFVEGVATENDAIELARSVYRALNDEWDFKGNRLSLGASLGVVLVENSDRTVETLCSRADRAMYHGKKQRLDGPVVWNTYDEGWENAPRAASA